MVAPSIVGFITRAQWGARAPKSVSRNITPGRGGVTLHYGGPAQRLFGDHAQCVARVRSWQNMHMDSRGWSDIAYTLLFCNHGFVFAGRGAGVRTAANGTDIGNQNWYAATYLGGEGEIPTDLAIAAGAWCVDNLRRHGGAGTMVNNHSNHKATACAGDPIRERLSRFIPSDGPAPIPGPAPTPGQRTLRLTPVPYMSGEDVKVAQRWAGAADDGSYGPNTRDAVSRKQASAGLGADGIVGPATWDVINRPQDPYVWLIGAIRQRWEGFSQELKDRLGKPLQGERPTAVSGGVYLLMEGGVMYWHPDSGAHPCYGGIFHAYARVKWESCPYLGFPTSEEVDHPEGRIQNFQRGSLLWRVGDGRVLAIHEI